MKRKQPKELTALERMEKELPTIPIQDLRARLQRFFAEADAEIAATTPRLDVPRYEHFTTADYLGMAAVGIVSGAGHYALARATPRRCCCCDCCDCCDC